MPAISRTGQQEVQEQKENKFWNFIPAANGKPPELLLYGAISSQQSWWEDRITPAMFNKELAELGDVPEIIVRINSGGGDVFAANAIYTRLKDHAAHVTVKIDGWAASAATIIAMAGDTIKIARNGVFMIHDPAMTVYNTFTAEEFEKLAEELQVIKQSIVNTYAMKTGRDEKEIADLMADEKWWTGDEAIEAGFCDEMLFDDVQAVAENENRVIVNEVALDVSAFKSLPKSLLSNRPKNPGGFTNSAATGIQSEKEEKGMAESTIKTVDALKAAYPDLVASIVNSAAKAERERIKAIKDNALDGFEDIVEDAMFVNPVSAETVCMKIVAEQKKQGGKYLEARDTDAKESGAGEVGASATPTGGQKEDPIDAAIDKLYGGKTNGNV